LKFLPLVASACIAWASLPAFASSDVPGSTPVYDIELDFSGDICTPTAGVAGAAACINGYFIGQDYGDVDGVVDTAHRTRHFGDLSLAEGSLQFWNNYSGSDYAAWGGSNGTAYVAEMVFTPAAGNRVSLQSLSFGSYQGAERTSTFMLLDAVTNQVLLSPTSFAVGASPYVVNFAGSISSAHGLVLRWGPDAYDVGLTNVQFSVAAVPEPETWAMLVAGLALMGTAARRRRSRSQD